MQKLFITLSALIITSPSYARGWIGPYSVSTIEIADGLTFFAAPAGVSNPDGCANPNFIVFNATDPLMNRIVAAGLTAKASGMQVRFLVSNCLTGYIYAERIEVD
jgi:hypothetical protein